MASVIALLLLAHGAVGLHLVTRGAHDFNVDLTVVNPGFESGSTTSDYEFAGTIPGWTNQGQNRYIKSLSPAWGGTASQAGNYFLGLKVGATVEQTVTAVAGYTYELRYYVAKRANSADPTLAVSVQGSTLATYIPTGASMYLQTHTFIAQSTSVVIKFENVSPAGDRTFFLDQVSITEVSGISAQGDPHISAQGDPHMVNLNGEKFDLLQRGVHVLLQVPQGADPQQTLLRIEANATGGRDCNYTFIKHLNITGKWAEEHRPSTGFQFAALPQSRAFRHRACLHLGKLSVGVGYGFLPESGTTYLNLRVQNLQNLGVPVGGLLGIDDHSKVSSTASCVVDPDYTNMSHAEQAKAGDVTVSAV